MDCKPLTVRQLLPPELLGGYTLGRSRNGSVNHLWSRQGSWYAICTPVGAQWGAVGAQWGVLYDPNAPLCEECAALLAREKK